MKGMAKKGIWTVSTTQESGEGMTFSPIIP
jgi:hypothetical protein